MSERRTDLKLLVVTRDESFASAVVEAIEATGATVSAESAITVGSTPTVNRDGSVDGAIVDSHIEEVPTVVDLLDGEQNLPVVVLANATENDDTITGALEAGAIDVFPRSRSGAQYELVVERIASDSRPDGDRSGEERSYTEVFENVSDGLVVHDPDTGEMLDVNRRYCEMNGYDREELVGESIDLISGPEHSYEEAQTRINNAREGKPQLFEWHNQRSDGTTFPVEVHLRVVEIGGEERVLASVRDISDRRRRERMIQRLHDFTQQLQKAETKDEVCQRTLRACQDILELPLVSCWLHRETDDEPVLEQVAATDAVQDATRTRFQPGDVECEVFHGDEVQVHDSTDLVATEGMDGVLLLPVGEHGLLAAGKRGADEYDGFVVNAAQGLADHVRTALDRIERERAVRESERRFRLIAERIDEVIYLAEPDFTEVLYVNPAYEDVYGQPVETLYSDPTAFREVIDERDRERFEADFRETVAEIKENASTDSYEFEFRVRRPDGEVRWVNLTGHVVELPSGKRRYVGIVDDITERKRREQRLEVFNRILRHNLRNKLAVIQSRAEILADRTTDDHAERILAAVNDLSEISTRARKTDRILSMDDAVIEFDLAETVRETIEVKASTRSDVAVTVELPESAPLWTNQPAVRIAVESALENAFEHATTTVTVAIEGSPDGYIVTIVDDGPGIPEEELVPIETGTETDLQHGIGLGLWELRWSVDKLNGELSFEVADGTTVHIKIPDRRERYQSG